MEGGELAADVYAEEYRNNGAWALVHLLDRLDDGPAFDEVFRQTPAYAEHLDRMIESLDWETEIDGDLRIARTPFALRYMVSSPLVALTQRLLDRGLIELSADGKPRVLPTLAGELGAFVSRLPQRQVRAAKKERHYFSWVEPRLVGKHLHSGTTDPESASRD